MKPAGPGAARVGLWTAPWVPIVYVLVAGAVMFGVRMLLSIGLETDVISPEEYAIGLSVRTVVVIVVSGVIFQRYAVRQRRAEARLRNIADAVPGMCALVDQDGIVTYGNAAFHRRLSLSTVAHMSLPLETVLAPYVSPMNRGGLLTAAQEKSVDFIVRGRDGIERTSTIHISRLDDQHDQLGWIVTSADDALTQESKLEQALRTQALDIATDGIAIADLRLPDTLLIYVNRAFRDITGYTSDEVLGRNMRILQGSDRAQPEIAMMRERIAKHQPVTVTLRNYRRDGTMFWNELRLVPLRDATGTASHCIGILRDVTELKQNARELAQLAYFDTVTQLYNRNRFTVALSGLLSRLDGAIVLMTLNVVRFNDLVSSFGETAGDVLLSGIAERLRSLPDLLLAGRLGDDSFAATVSIAEDSDAARVIDAAHAALRVPFRLQGGDVDLRFYVGVAIGRRGMTATTLLHQSLVALNQSRKLRGGGTRIFDSAAAEEIRRRVELSRDLQQAIARGDFTLLLQPIVSLQDDLWIAVEGLVRWRHAVFGLQSPSLFLDIAEQTGQILEIDLWSLRSAAMLATRLNKHRQGPIMPVSINLSALRLQQHDLVAALRRILAETGADPTSLRLEIAEQALASGSAETITMLARLRALGFGIVVDGFGATTSCLVHLAKLPVTGIKIDSSFIRDCDTSPFHQKVIDSFATLARTLSIEVCAMGVQTEAQKRTLQRLGIRQAQGMLLCAPLDPEDFAAVALSTNATVLAADRGPRRLPPAAL